LNNTLHKLSFAYIFNFRKDKAFSVSTILSSLALILGISILITVMSVMNGFREQLVDSLSGVNGDITIYDVNKDKIKQIKEKNPSISLVQNVQSRVITSNEKGIEGLLMKSLYKQDLYKIPKINQNLFEIERETENWVFIGVELARSLNLKVGMPFTINIPGKSMTILGPVLNSKELIIKGIFNTGVYDFDKYFIFSNIEQFNKKINNSVIDIYLNGKSFNYTDLDGLNYSTWEDQNQTLAQALTTEKNVMFIILFFIIIISSFTIISNQIFFIKEKYKDIILLKVLGIKQSKICFLFFLNSFFISFFSIIIGTCLGLLLSTNINSVESFLSYLFNFELWNNEIRYLSSMPYSIKINDIMFIVSISLFSSLIASYIPILRIFKIKPNLVLR